MQKSSNGGENRRQIDEKNLPEQAERRGGNLSPVAEMTRGFRIY